MPEQEQPPIKKTPLELLRAIRDIAAGGKESPLRETAEKVRMSLEQGLNSRFSQFGSSLRFNIPLAKTPENLTEKHLEALKTIFGQNNLEPMICPKPEALHNLDENYQAVMYPITKTDKDKQPDKNGLVAFRPDWWNKPAEISGFDFQNETWGQAYIRSMKQELEQMGNQFIFIESIQKPNYTDDKQHYGTKDGRDSSKDPLLPVFQEVFGRDANRFNHSWDELNNQLLPKIREKILQAFKKHNLPILDFQIILAPAVLFNLQTILFHPENSQTGTSEWTSTILTDRNNQDSGRRLDVGRVDYGGAPHVVNDPRGTHWAYRGVRLAVVF